MSGKHQVFKSCGKDRQIINDMGSLGDDRDSIRIEISNREAWELAEELLGKLRKGSNLGTAITFFGKMDG